MLVHYYVFVEMFAYKKCLFADINRFSKLFDTFNILIKENRNIHKQYTCLEFTPPLHVFPTNQFAQKFKCLANLITYFVNMCDIN